MTAPDSFDPDRDPAMGTLLRAHLEAPDPAGFVRRIVAATTARRASPGVDRLAAWSLPGLAAAAAIILALGLWLGRAVPAAESTVSLAEAFSPQGVQAEFVNSTLPPDRDMVLAVALGGQGHSEDTR